MGRKKNTVTTDEMNPLIYMLLAKAQQDGLNNHEISRALGVSYPYWMSMANGNREIKQADHKVFVGAAKLLGFPTAQAYLLSGRMTPGDFVVELDGEQKINSTLQEMRNDPVWSGFVPSKLKVKNADKDLLLLIHFLYEKLNQKEVNEDMQSKNK